MVQRAGSKHRRGSGIGPGGLGLALLLLQAGCGGTGELLEQEHEEDLEAAEPEPLTVIDYFPEHAVPGVPKSIQPYFFFNREVQDPAELELALSNLSGYAIPFSFLMDFDNAGITFIPASSVYGASGLETFQMSLEAGTGEALVEASSFSTLFPGGTLFNMSEELRCTRFGGSQAQAKLLNTYFDPGVYPLWIMVPEDVTPATRLPVVTDLLMGPAYIRSSGTYRIYRHVGFSTVFHDVQIEADGRFSAWEEGVFLPLDTPEKVVLTYMVQASMEGRIDFSQSPARIRDLVIHGIFPARSLLLLADESEGYETAVDYTELDVDLNGNGVNDAATFEAVSEPAEIRAELWDP